VTCGTQFPPAEQRPQRCPICGDELQFIGLQGQQWITLQQLQRTHRNTLYQEREGIWGGTTTPAFGIGQRALLMRTEKGNILWDCVSLIDPDTVTLIKALGGISAIAISHPRYYTSMVEWSRAFGGVPIYLHESDQEWVQRSDCSREISHKSVRTGGMSPSCTAIRTSFRLTQRACAGFVSPLEPFSFTKLYGAWPHFVVQGNAKEVVRRSAERYLRALERGVSEVSVGVSGD